MKNCLIILSLVFGFSYKVHAQGGGSISGYDATSSAFGKTSTAISTGLFAVGKNPANILNVKKYWEVVSVFPLPSFNFRVGTDFITLKDYNYYFCGVTDAQNKKTGRYLSLDDKEKLKSIFEGGELIFTDLSAQIFSVLYKPNTSIGAFAFSIFDVASASMNFPQDIITLGLYGNDISKVFNFNDADCSAWWIRKYSFSYAKNFPDLVPKYMKELSIGISCNVVTGFAYAGINEVDVTTGTSFKNEIIGKSKFIAYSSFSKSLNVEYDFENVSEKKRYSFNLFPSPAGFGFGFDFGFNLNVNDVTRIALAVTDIGKIKWTERVAEFSSNSDLFLDDITNKKQRDSLVDNLFGDGKFVGSIITDLPTALRFGFSLQLNKPMNYAGKFLFAMDYNQGFNNQPGNSKIARFSFGLEWVPPNWIFAFRTGCSLGGYDKFGWALGLGIESGLLEFNFALPEFQYLFTPDKAKKIAFSCDSRWRF